MKLIKLDDIKRALKGVNLPYIIEEGFRAYSTGNAVIPPVGELLFDDPTGEVHIKYGYLKGDAFYVVKIASGFYDNVSLGVPSSSGLMLVFSARTGEPLALLQDEGYLTDLRTAVAGGIAAKYLAPREVRRIGIVGTGTQARLQLLELKRYTECKDVLYWGRDESRAAAYKRDMEEEGFSLRLALDPKEIAMTCNLIVTTTPSKEPLIMARDVMVGTHITAVGSDSLGKQELDERLLARAERLVVDSLSQAKERGELAHALSANLVLEGSATELGHIIAGEHSGRTSEKQITVADLTGVAVQDIQVATAVYERLS